MNTDIRRLADLAGVTLTEHTLPPARAIRTTLTAVGLDDQPAAVVESAVRMAVSKLSIDVSDFSVDRETGTIVVYPTITTQGISTQQLEESKADLIRVLSSRSTVRQAKSVSENYDSEELANDVYAEFERIYPHLARRAHERTIHAAIMDVLNYDNASNPSALAHDVARAVKRDVEGISESADSKHPSEATVARDLKARYGEANYSSKATGSTHKVIHDGNYYRSGMMRSKTLSGLLNTIDKKVNNKAPATGTMTINGKGTKAGAVKESLNTRAIKIPLEDVELENAAVEDIQVYVDAALQNQDVLDIANWEIAHFTDLLFYTVGDEQPSAAEIRSFGKTMVTYLTDPENVNGAISATTDEENDVEESLTEISTNLRNRYVQRASDDYGAANFAARASSSHPGLEDYSKEQERRRDRRRVGLNRALSDKRTGRATTTEGNRGDYGYPSFSVAKARELVRSGNWEAMSDIKPGRHVEMRNTRTGKRTTVQITESVPRSNLGHAQKTALVTPTGGQYEAVHESHVTKSGTTNVFGYLDLRTGSTTMTHTVDGTLTEAAIKRHLEDVRFPLN